jgi:hypothetical protein
VNVACASAWARSAKPEHDHCRFKSRALRRDAQTQIARRGVCREREPGALALDGLAIDRISAGRRNFGGVFDGCGVMSCTTRWAAKAFGEAELGDERRTKRLVAMAARAARAPAPHVTEVFREAAERQAAYDFLEHDQVPVEGVGEALFRSTTHACGNQDRVLVVLDGTSLTLTDRARAKDFGAIGTYTRGARGIKVVNALALTDAGTPIGVADQQWWTRQFRVGYNWYRRKDDRESRHWRVAVERIGERFAAHAPDTRLHFLVDREGDAAHLICALVDAGHEFTIRSAARRITLVGKERRNLLEALARRPVLARTTVELPETARCAARRANLDIRAAYLPIRFRDKFQRNRRGRYLNVSVVWARERGSRPDRLEWVLFTNAAVTSAAEACEALRRYTRRWRIEDFHRTWKSGLCGVEQTQLRSTNAVIKWATILAAVASRAEHLRRRAREEPDIPATDELSDDEIEAVVLLKNDSLSPRRTPVSSKGLTLATAVRWIADLGGYVGNRNSGLPGATTIGRGLEPVLMTAAVLAKLRAEGRLR